MFPFTIKNRVLSKLTALLLAILVVSTFPGRATAQIPVDKLTSRLDALMKNYEEGETPGAAIGVIREGELVFSKAYGTADLTHNVPITTETRFNLGSASKQFTGFALAILEKRGKLLLDDPVSKYLPEWPTFEHTVTIRHVLTHSSGYRQAYGMLGLSGWRSRDYLPREEVLELVRRQPKLEFEPGTQFRYNSTGYVILAKVIEEVTGRSFPQWMEENVFGPLGMDNTTIESEVGELIPGSAYSYGKGENGGYRLMFSNRAIFGAAEVYTTLGDFAKWLGNYGSAKLGGASVRERMRERLVLASGDTTEYALGIFVGKLQGLPQVWHGGSHAGYNAFFSYAPDHDTGMLVMSNYDEFPLGKVFFTISNIIFSDYRESASQGSKESELTAETVNVDSLKLKQYAGHYQSDNKDVYTFNYQEQILQMASGRELIALSDTLFRVEGQSTRFAFHPESDGSVEQATIYSSSGEKTPVQRIKPWDPSPEVLEKFSGRYINAELETIYTLTVQEGQLVAEHRWNGKIRLKPQIVEGKLHGQWLEIQFTYNEEGGITGFDAAVGLTSDVWFEKVTIN